MFIIYVLYKISNIKITWAKLTDAIHQKQLTRHLSRNQTCLSGNHHSRKGIILWGPDISLPSSMSAHAVLAALSAFPRATQLAVMCFLCGAAVSLIGWYPTFSMSTSFNTSESRLVLTFVCVWRMWLPDARSSACLSWPHRHCFHLTVTARQKETLKELCRNNETRPPHPHPHHLLPSSPSHQNSVNQYFILGSACKAPLKMCKSMLLVSLGRLWELGAS